MVRCVLPGVEWRVAIGDGEILRFYLDRYGTYVRRHPHFKNKIESSNFLFSSSQFFCKKDKCRLRLQIIS